MSLVKVYGIMSKIQKGFLMHTIEFEAKIENGVVHVPKNIEDLEHINKAKFIMIFDKDNKNIKVNNKKRKMSAISIDTVGFKFDREEAHER